MKKLLCLLSAALLTLLPLSPQAHAQNTQEESSVYRLITLDGAYLTSHAGRVYMDDEYISADNQLYIVVQVNDETQTAVAAHIGEEPPANRDKAREVFAYAENTQAPERKLICMYSTHSDESYVPTDGEASLLEDAGIYDVNAALKEELEKLGVTVILDETSHLPHDTKAYSRSRRTAEELLKRSPDALLDIHRDGIPDKNEYLTEVNGEETSKVRLLVGRSNPNVDANREFAKLLKETADEKYSGLIKDIFIGKGNYNQELYPKAILLEFGTHTLDKDLVLNSTPMMADVLYTVLYGDSAQAAPSGQNTEDTQNKAGGNGIMWLVIIAGLGGLIYLLISSGTLKNLGSRISRAASEITGGSLGRREKDDDPTDTP